MKGIMQETIITQVPVRALSEYHILRDGKYYFIFHRVNGTMKRRSAVTCAEAYELYTRLGKCPTIGECYSNVAKVGCFEKDDSTIWALTAWLYEEVESENSIH